MNWAARHPILMWTFAWGVTGAALYISGVFNSPRDGPLWVALVDGAISWSIAGASTFPHQLRNSPKRWNVPCLVIWALAYFVSFALAGFFGSLSAFGDTILRLLLMFMGWSIGAALGAFASTWLTSYDSKRRRSAIVAGMWLVGFFAGSFIAFMVSFLAAELAKLFIGLIVGIPAALVLGFAAGSALGGFVASAIAISATRRQLQSI